MLGHPRGRQHGQVDKVIIQRCRRSDRVPDQGNRDVGERATTYYEDDLRRSRTGPTDDEELENVGESGHGGCQQKVDFLVTRSHFVTAYPMTPRISARTISFLRRNAFLRPGRITRMNITSYSESVFATRRSTKCRRENEVLIRAASSVGSYMKLSM